MRALRGNRMAMIFQEPMTSLNPAFTIGEQIVEALALPPAGEPWRGARAAAIEALRQVRMPDAERAASTSIRTGSPAACASAR